MGEQEDPTVQLQRLHEGTNDLIGILAIRPAGIGQVPSDMLATVLDTLVAAVRLDFACARLDESTGDARLDLARLSPHLEATTRPEDICRALQPWLSREPPAGTSRVRYPGGPEEASIARFRLGLHDDLGVLVAGSSRLDFPTEFEGFLLQVAANQAAIGLLEARRRQEQKRLGEQLERRAVESEEWLRRLADASPEVVWISALDPERVVYVSPSFERVWGLPVEELYRDPHLWIETIHPEDRARVAETFTRWEAGEDVNWQDVEFRIIQPGGAIRWIQERGVLFRTAEGRPYQVSGISTDVTDRKRAEQELRRSEAYLAEAQRLSLTGSFGWTVSSAELFWSRETFRIMGYDPDVRPTLELILERVHPEDAERVDQALERARRDGADMDLEHRCLMVDGSVKHVHVWAHAERDLATGGLEFVGAVMDVTSAKQAREALERAFGEIQALKERLQQENIALREELDKASMFEEIVGTSSALRAVLANISRVAPTDSTVLISGETGTGKELVARAIHKRSVRAARPFVSVNCAAVPASLIASELFGHEKGAFTGAVQRRQGRFELAAGGTIFLDEVGDLPAETQVALLRVLQEHEFERVGGSRPIPTDVRVIAATNRDLEKAIADKSFRADLFYRLNVFPLEVPPLRERRADLPLLVEYFTHRFANRAGKRIGTISRATLDLFNAYDWPGNIRELQNVIERAVIVSDGSTLSVDERWLSGGPAREPPGRASGGLTLDAQERDLILATLAETKGRVGGPFGAATKLGMPPSTLESKIKALRIDKHRYKTASPSGEPG
jgi:PAS domain S-box-containing protein